MIPKLAGHPPLVWNPCPMCLGHAPRLEPDLRLTRLVPALTLNLLCDVGQVTHHLGLSSPGEKEKFECDGL